MPFPPDHGGNFGRLRSMDGGFTYTVGNSVYGRREHHVVMRGWAVAEWSQSPVASYRYAAKEPIIPMFVRR